MFFHVHQSAIVGVEELADRWHFGQVEPLGLTLELGEDRSREATVNSFFRIQNLVEHQDFRSLPTAHDLWESQRRRAFWRLECSHERGLEKCVRRAVNKIRQNHRREHDTDTPASHHSNCRLREASQCQQKGQASLVHMTHSCGFHLLRGNLKHTRERLDIVPARVVLTPMNQNHLDRIILFDLAHQTQQALLSLERYCVFCLWIVVLDLKKTGSTTTPGKPVLDSIVLGYGFTFHQTLNFIWY